MFEKSQEEVEWFYEVFDPEEFDISPVESVWRSPSSIALYVTLQPSSDAATKRVMLPRKLEFVFDTFARFSVRGQFYDRYWGAIDELRAYAPRWSRYLIDRLPDFERLISGDSKLFESQFRYVEKSDFRKVSLTEILREEAELVDVYVAEDWDSYGHRVSILRMHSAVWHFVQDKKYHWFEKRVPWIFYDEDILPWFRALIERLPKKNQPADLLSWLGRLIRNHREFIPDIPQAGQEWESKSRIALIFGTIDQIGLSNIHHIERSEIRSFLRNDAEIQIRALRLKIFIEGSEEWIFRIFTRDSKAAHRLEEQFLEGRYMHFGLGDDIDAILGLADSRIECVGLTNEQILAFCKRPGFFLGSFCDSRLKHKTLHYYSEDNDRGGFTYVLE